MKNYTNVQGFISLAAILCIVTGWFHLFSPEVDNFLSKRLFYILVGLSFIFSATTYPDNNKKYLSYTAAALCIIGAFLPDNLSVVKSIGLFAGVILTFFARQRRA